MKTVKIVISGYGGEHTIGKLTKEQADFWKEKDSEELTRHISGIGTDDYEHPIYDWFEIDDIDHTFGCINDFDTMLVEITFGDEPVKTIKDISEFGVELGGVVMYDEVEENSPCLLCFSEDKGVFFNYEFEVEDDAVFNEEDFIFIEKEIVGMDFVVGMKYKDINLEDYDSGCDTTGKSFSVEIV